LPVPVTLPAITLPVTPNVVPMVAELLIVKPFIVALPLALMLENWAVLLTTIELVTKFSGVTTILVHELLAELYL
jgi:hypothetical protein